VSKNSKRRKSPGSIWFDVMKRAESFAKTAYVRLPAFSIFATAQCRDRSAGLKDCEQPERSVMLPRSMRSRAVTPQHAHCIIVLNSENVTLLLSAKYAPEPVA
jgi:hypothetical protein